MKRESEPVYRTDEGKKLLTIRGCMATLEIGYSPVDADTLDELATAASAAADELRAAAAAAQRDAVAVS